MLHHHRRLFRSSKRSICGVASDALSDSRLTSPIDIKRFAQSGRQSFLGGRKSHGDESGHHIGCGTASVEFSARNSRRIDAARDLAVRKPSYLDPCGIPTMPKRSPVHPLPILYRRFIDYMDASMRRAKPRAVPDAVHGRSSVGTHWLASYDYHPRPFATLQRFGTGNSIPHTTIYWNSVQ